MDEEKEEEWVLKKARKEPEETKVGRGTGAEVEGGGGGSGGGGWSGGGGRSGGGRKA